MRPRIAVLASGNGTTAETIIRAIVAQEVSYDIGLIIASCPDAGIIARVTKLNEELGQSIAIEVVGASNYPAEPDEVVSPGCQTKAEEAKIMSLLKAGSFELVVLLGYMKKIGPDLVSSFGWRRDYLSPYEAQMINTHPGLLPETKGLYGMLVQQYVIDHKLTAGGQTLHIVAENYDEGPMIAEHLIPVLDNDTPEHLFERVQLAEKQYIALDIDTFIQARREYLVQHSKALV